MWLKMPAENCTGPACIAIVRFVQIVTLHKNHLGNHPRPLKSVFLSTAIHKKTIILRENFLPKFSQLVEDSTI